MLYFKLCKGMLLFLCYPEFRTSNSFPVNFVNSNMSREEVKTAIYELLEHSSEQVLQEVFDYLKSIDNESERSITLSHNLRTILTEDKELLERLAQ